MKRATLFFVLVICVFLVGCTALQVTLITEAVANNTALVAALVAPTCSATVTANCLTAAQKADLAHYAQQADVFLGEAAIVLAAGGTPSAMYSQLVQDAAVLVQANTTGLPSSIAGLVAMDMHAISAILTAYAPPAVVPAASARANVGMVAAEKPVHFGGGDLARLKTAQVKIAENEAAIARLK